jgi:hypothetical protein
MPHVIEPASSGRAKCRGCGRPVPKGELRFGEALPNPFADGQMRFWYHLECAAFKRPEPFLEALGAGPPAFEQRERLEGEARRGLAHHRLPRIDGAERSPSERARCRSCREPIAKGDWRIRLVFNEEGRFAPSGFIHACCALTYFETAEVLERVSRFSPDLSDEDVSSLKTTLDSPAR